jgi:hypothetical protein
VHDKYLSNAERTERAEQNITMDLLQNGTSIEEVMLREVISRRIDAFERDTASYAQAAQALLSLSASFELGDGTQAYGKRKPDEQLVGERAKRSIQDFWC